MAIPMTLDQLRELHSAAGESVRAALISYLEDLRGEVQTVLESATATDPERRDAAAQRRVIGDLLDCLAWDSRAHRSLRVAAPA